MRKFILLFSVLLLSTAVFGQYQPDRKLGELFEEVQNKGIFSDSKTFADAVPRYPVGHILQKYYRSEPHTDAELKAFVEEYFVIPESPETPPATGTKSIEEHIDKLWSELVRKDTTTTGSLIALPHPYVVPGGRFNEMYYWDSYFSMLGLEEAGRYDLIRDMIRNFAWMIDEFGFIPNGTRTYYLTRSQPPFFSLMADLLAGIEGDSIYTHYLPQLQEEYDYWMRGSENLSAEKRAFRNVVWLDQGMIMNRYWDSDSTPRPEAYKEDIATAKASSRPPEIVYRDIRSACESGWDFSSRWLGDGVNLHSIHTTDIVPVDLNALLFHLEKTLAKAYGLSGNETRKDEYLRKAEHRRMALMEYCWSPDREFFMDYDFVKEENTPVYSLAGMYPLYLKMVDSETASMVATNLERIFFREGGVPATLRLTGEQWDAPNGWAPLQWICYKGLKNYAFDEMADTLKGRWMTTVRKEHSRTGKILEKYNVLYPGKPGGGGEYPTQDGFGWTNGVYLKMMGGD